MTRTRIYFFYQVIKLTGTVTSTLYKDNLRRTKFYDEENDRAFIFLSNNHALPALTIAKLYKERWMIELFFKWIKQHLRINAFMVKAKMKSKLKFGLQYQCM
ncbi:MAG: transposase [Ignavibacteria bacterium]